MTLAAAELALLRDARRASLATIDARGRPRLVPICFVVSDDVLWSPLDEKPKSVGDLRSLARVRDIFERPSVSVLVDRWSEDWSELAWLRIVGRAQLVDPAPPAVVEALRAKYPQYRGHRLESRPMLAITIDGVTAWRASSAEGDATGRALE